YVDNDPVNEVDPFGFWKLGIHERITEEAFQRLLCRLSYSSKDLLEGLKMGSKGPDIPDGIGTATKFFVDVESGIYSDDTIRYYWGTSLTYRSHYGDLQWWHGMVSNERTPGEMQQKMINLFIDNVSLFRSNVERDPIAAATALGFGLHMIEDSFSKSHVQRASDWTIRRFQSYPGQDSHRHGDADSEVGSAEYQRAVAVVEHLLRLVLCDNADESDIRKYLTNEALRISPRTVVGGSLNEYRRLQ
ncbi:MAG: hypothetical protein HW412_2506, partial [Bacteroidetes bacterium]|nr:hypothetical protein [Bacteroidota bacterium]